MATAEPLTLKDLKKLAQLLKIVRLNKGADWQAGSGFEAAVGLMGFLRDTRVALQDLHPRLSEYNREGPFYGSWPPEEDRYHLFVVKWRINGSIRSIDYGVSFPTTGGDPTWFVDFCRDKRRTAGFPKRVQLARSPNAPF